MTRGAVAIVEAAGPGAAQALATLEAACFDSPWSGEALRVMLEDGLTRAWLASVDGAIVAAALLRVVAGEGELLRIAVQPAWRRHGLGRALLRSIQSAVADACPLGVHLEVRASNTAARQLYSSVGFIERGTRRGYYQGPVEDAILLHWNSPAAPERGCRTPLET